MREASRLPTSQRPSPSRGSPDGRQARGRGGPQRGDGSDDGGGSGDEAAVYVSARIGRGRGSERGGGTPWPPLDDELPQAAERRSPGKGKTGQELGGEDSYYSGGGGYEAAAAPSTKGGLVSGPGSVAESASIAGGSSIGDGASEAGGSISSAADAAGHDEDLAVDARCACSGSRVACVHAALSCVAHSWLHGQCTRFTCTPWYLLCCCCHARSGAPSA